MLLPDWKEESQYPDPKTLSDEGWAWEFLRRDENYEKAWLSYREIERKILPKYGPEESWSIEVRNGTEVWHFEPPLLPGETQWQWRLRTRKAGLQPLRRTFEEAMASEWRLLLMADPSVSASKATPPFIPRRVAITYYLTDLEAEAVDPPPAFSEMPDRWDCALVQIDLRRYLTPQIEYVMKELSKKQSELEEAGSLTKERKVNPKAPYYRQILRVFDAYLANSGLDEDKRLKQRDIAKYIFGEHPSMEDPEKAIGRMYATAKSYVYNKGYLAIIG